MGEADTEEHTGCDSTDGKRPEQGNVHTHREWVPGCQGLGEGMGLMLMRMGFPSGVVRVF